MKNKSFVIFLLFFLTLFFQSCQRKDLNSQILKMQVGEEIPLSQFIHNSLENVMIVSNRNREEIIMTNCKQVDYKQDYESFDFILLCTDMNDFGYIYVIHPYFGWFDSIEIKSEIDINVFYKFNNLMIKRETEKGFSIYCQ